MDKEFIRKSKHLAFLLRHDTEYDFDRYGWMEVKDLVRNHGYTKKELEEIVASNDKQRYEFNQSHTKIRACQGHSIKVDVELQNALPPAILYHGTCTKNLESIYKHGIQRGNRIYVHLSKSKEEALKVGSRHGTPFVLEVDCESMVAEGFKFCISNNGIWLTEEVPSKYIRQ